MPEFKLPDEEDVITLLDRLAAFHLQNARAWWRGKQYTRQQSQRYMDTARVKIAILAAQHKLGK